MQEDLELSLQVFECDRVLADDHSSRCPDGPRKVSGSAFGMDKSHYRESFMKSYGRSIS